MCGSEMRETNTGFDENGKVTEITYKCLGCGKYGFRVPVC